jgi:hypothetical protein
MLLRDLAGDCPVFYGHDGIAFGVGPTGRRGIAFNGAQPTARLDHPLSLAGPNIRVDFGLILSPALLPPDVWQGLITGFDVETGATIGLFVNNLNQLEAWNHDRAARDPQAPITSELSLEPGVYYDVAFYVGDDGLGFWEIDGNISTIIPEAAPTDWTGECLVTGLFNDLYDSRLYVDCITNFRITRGGTLATHWPLTDNGTPGRNGR